MKKNFLLKIINKAVRLFCNILVDENLIKIFYCNLMCRHGSEPAVRLTYSDKSSTSATISLGVGNEVTRDSYHPGITIFLHFRCISYLYFSQQFIRQDRLEVVAMELSVQVRAIMANSTVTVILEKVSIFILCSLMLALQIFMRNAYNLIRIRICTETEEAAYIDSEDEDCQEERFVKISR